MDDIWNALFENLPVNILSLLGALAVILLFFVAIIKVVVHSIERQNDKAIQAIKESYQDALKANADTIKILVENSQTNKA